MVFEPTREPTVRYGSMSHCYFPCGAHSHQQGSTECQQQVQAAVRSVVLSDWLDLPDGRCWCLCPSTQVTLSLSCVLLACEGFA